DHGPIIIQAAVPVLRDDSEQTLAARVLNQEHRIYPQAVKWLCNENIDLDNHGKVVFRNRKQSGFALVSPSLE
ncbi:MAG TPA: formyltransferase family protein, partial [Gallionella sp.]|nr:formyltransferase family protein [Gallionella sp.]